MNFSEQCQQSTLTLQRLHAVVTELDRNAGELEVSRDDEPLLVRLVQGFLECNRLSEKLLYDQVPHIEQDEPAVGTALRLAHDELMRRARGAQTDVEIYTKLKATRQRKVPLLHAV